MLGPLSPVEKSTMIGVFISIGGNIIISLALNVQKLAHSRLAASSSQQPPPSSSSPAHTTSSSSSPPYTPKPTPSSLPATEDTPLLPPSLLSNPWTEVPGHSPHSADPPIQSRSTGSSEYNYLKSKTWWLGQTLLTVGEFGNFLSYGFSPASVIAPLGTVALIANGVFAPLIVGETFRPSDILGVLFAIVGAVIVVMSSKDSQVVLGPDALKAALLQASFLVYAGAVFGVSVVLAVMSELGWDDRFYLIDVILCSGLGGFTVLSTKAISSLLSTYLAQAFALPIFYPVLLVLILTAIGQLRYLNRALARHPSKIIIPTQFVFFSLSAILGSAFLYRDFDDISLPRFLTFSLGILITFLGVLLLTPSISTPPSSPSPSPPSSPPPSHTPSLYPSTLTTPSPSPKPPLLDLPSRPNRPRSSSRGLSTGLILLTSSGGGSRSRSESVGRGEMSRSFEARRLAKAAAGGDHLRGVEEGGESGLVGRDS